MIRKYADSQKVNDQLWFITKVSVLVTSILLVGLIAMILLVLELLPLKEIRPFLVQFHAQSEQVVTIKPLHVSKEATEQLMAYFVRQYVILRETIDLQTDRYRWKQVSLFSSLDITETFEELMDPADLQSPWNDFEQRQVQRQVKILNVQHLAPQAPNMWLIEWQGIDREIATKTVVQQAAYTSTLIAHSREIKVDYEDQYVNPIGFTVTHYQVVKKNV